MDKETEKIINNIDFSQWVADALRDSAKDQTKNNAVSGSSDAVQGSHNVQKQTKKQKADKTTKEKRKAAGRENTQGVNTSADAAGAKDHVNQKAAADHAENIKDNADYNNKAAGGADASADIAADASGALPSDYIETIENIISDYMLKYNIEDMSKAHAQQWRAACMYCGMWAKENKVYIDTEKSRRQGGRVYDIEKIDKALSVWAFLCSSYRKTPLVGDFIDFVGVSSSWFYNANGHCDLTAAGGEIYKKLCEIQKKGFVSGISDGRENPTGKIYLTKALFGWSDTGGGLLPADDRQEKSAALPDLSVLELPKL